VSVAAGRGDRALIEFSADPQAAADFRAILMVTMSDGEIVAMQDYRRRKKALRAAQLLTGD
jgi:hypothetical protein